VLRLNPAGSDRPDGGSMKYLLLGRSFPRLKFVLGMGLCAAAAASLCFLFRNSSAKSTVPLLFIGLLFAVAVRFGALAGILGTISSAAIFALFLFEPLHRLAINNAGQKENVGWMLVGGIVLSGLFGRQLSSRQDEGQNHVQ
jgi:K+-sensing histidine kinase KdpD